MFRSSVWLLLIEPAALFSMGVDGGIVEKIKASMTSSRTGPVAAVFVQSTRFQSEWIWVGRFLSRSRSKYRFSRAFMQEHDLNLADNDINDVSFRQQVLSRANEKTLREKINKLKPSAQPSGALYSYRWWLTCQIRDVTQKSIMRSGIWCVFVELYSLIIWAFQLTSSSRPIFMSQYSTSEMLGCKLRDLSEALLLWIKLPIDVLCGHLLELVVARLEHVSKTGVDTNAGCSQCADQQYPNHILKEQHLW